MNRDQAERCVGFLIGRTTGWTDDSVAAYVDDLTELTDPEVAAWACRFIARTWSEARRPPLGLILDTYRSEMGRRDLYRPAIVEGGIIEPLVGVEVARQAYAAECRHQGRPANMAIFDAWMAAFTR